MSKQSKRDERIRLAKTFSQFFSRYEYERMPGGLGCFYCGEHEQSLDHSPPMAWIELRKVADWKKSGIELVTVPCCADCNAILSDRPLFTQIDRVRFIEKKLIDRYERKVVQWEEDELQEMSHMFREKIKGKKALNKLLLNRLRGAQWRVMREVMREEK